MSLDVELMTNDEEIEQALRKYKEDLAGQRQKVEEVFGQVSYERNIILQSQKVIDQVTAADAEYDDKLHDVLLVCTVVYFLFCKHLLILFFLFPFER